MKTFYKVTIPILVILGVTVSLVKHENVTSTSSVAPMTRCEYKKARALRCIDNAKTEAKSVAEYQWILARDCKPLASAAQICSSNND